MPEICRFYGVVIMMYFNDHEPPHFHATYGGSVAIFGIERMELLRGQLSQRAQRLVVEWGRLHQPELRREWGLAREREPLFKIAPLE